MSTKDEDNTPMDEPVVIPVLTEPQEHDGGSTEADEADQLSVPISSVDPKKTPEATKQALLARLTACKRQHDSSEDHYTGLKAKISASAVKPSGAGAPAGLSASAALRARLAARSGESGESRGPKPSSSSALQAKLLAARAAKQSSPAAAATGGINATTESQSSSAKLSLQQRLALRQKSGGERNSPQSAPGAPGLPGKSPSAALQARLGLRKGGLGHSPDPEFETPSPSSGGVPAPGLQARLGLHRANPNRFQSQDMDVDPDGIETRGPGLGLRLGRGSGKLPLPMRGSSLLSSSKGGGAGKIPTNCDLLLVEDVRVSQRIAQVALTRAKFKVDMAMDGETAVDKYKQHHEHLKVVLMDIQLPGISGIEAADQIRSFEKEVGKKPCMMFGLTGNVDEENLKGMKDVGMNGCIAKGKLLSTSVRQAMEEMKKDPTQFVSLTDIQ